MIFHSIREHLRRWLCPGCEACNQQADLTRLDRAEQLHTLSGLAVSIETEKQVKRVSDMRIAATAAVKRLAHEKREMQGEGQR
jgi:hypothetical protein